jgi:hypothetical protein
MVKFQRCEISGVSATLALRPLNPLNPHQMQFPRAPSSLLCLIRLELLVIERILTQARTELALSTAQPRLA